MDLDWIGGVESGEIIRVMKNPAGLLGVNSVCSDCCRKVQRNEAEMSIRIELGQGQGSI